VNLCLGTDLSHAVMHQRIKVTTVDWMPAVVPAAHQSPFGPIMRTTTTATSYTNCPTATELQEQVFWGRDAASLRAKNKAPRHTTCSTRPSGDETHPSCGGRKPTPATFQSARQASTTAVNNAACWHTPHYLPTAALPLIKAFSYSCLQQPCSILQDQQTQRLPNPQRPALLC
jgi:hypothetical protein